MKTEREKLRLVRAESELRVGMLLKLKECRACGSAHRMLLLGAVDNAGGWHEGYSSPCRARRLFLRTQPCAASPATGYVCWELPVAERRLYIVDTGITDEASPYVAVPAPKPRSRTVRT